jgi:predicted transcriptional regulator of viral defense system
MYRMRTREYIDRLTAGGCHHFTAKEAACAMHCSFASVHGRLRRLKQSGVIAEPTRGFLVIVPPEYRQLGCLPPEQFVPQLLALAAEPYYFCLLTAAQHHGAAHQRPQATQVMVRKNRRGIECGEVRVEFIARSDVDQMDVVEANTPRGVVRFSTPEVTALELTGYPKHSGGLSNVATVLSELSEEIDPVSLVEAARLSPLSWAQRLGYLLDLVDRSLLAHDLGLYVAEQARSYTPLRRAAGTAGFRVPTWKVIVNVDVEPDL